MITQVVPEIGTLFLPTEGNQLEVAFRDPYVPGYSHNLKSLGTGVEQLLLTMVVGLTHPEPSTVLIEEPETNLHPGAQRALLTLLEECSKDRAFIVSTHSAAMLDWTRPEHIFMVSKAAGVSTIASAANDPISILSERGVRLSDVLSAEQILLTDGDTDKSVLEAWFPKELLNPKLAVVSGGGGANARLSHVLEEWLSKTDRLSRRILFLRDRDELSPDFIERLERSGTVRVLRRREIENYLLEPDAIREVINQYGPASGAVTSEAVAATMEEAANSLMKKVIIGRVLSRLESIRLADQSLKGSLVEADATVEDMVSAVLERVPGPDDLAARVRSLWREEEAMVAGSWEDQRYDLAPGADILDQIFRRLADRGYGKGTDGPAIARLIGAPSEIGEALAHLAGSPGDTLPENPERRRDADQG